MNSYDLAAARCGSTFPSASSTNGWTGLLRRSVSARRGVSYEPRANVGANGGKAVPGDIATQASLGRRRAV